MSLRSPRRTECLQNLSLFRKDWDTKHINKDMEDILTPRNVSRRQQHQQKLRQSQQSQMDSKRVEKDRRDFNQSVSASNDQ